MMTISNAIRLFVLLVFITTNAYGSKSHPDTLVIGKISHNPKKHYLYLRPMVKYVVEQMHDLGITKVKIRMAKNSQQLAKWMKQGEVDWVTETAYASGLLMAQASAEPLLLKMKKGVENYHSIIFVRKDSGITQLSDLKGKIVAFEDMASTTAFFEPALIFLAEGLALKELDTIDSAVGGNETGVVFAGEEISIATWVEKGKVSAGAVSNNDWDKSDHVPEKFRTQFRIINTSDKLPRAIETVRKELPSKVKKRLKKVLLEAKNSSDGLTAMWAYQRTTGFKELESKQIFFLENSYRQINQVVQAIRSNQK